MKAVRFHETGAADVLRYEEIEQPVPGAGDVLIRVAGRGTHLCPKCQVLEQK